MDPVTIVIVLVVLELATGGVSGAVGAAGGAVGEGAKAAWDETKKGANSWYAKRAKDLSKTRRGRARLAAEKRAAGAAAFVGRGVRAGVKAAPDGARNGWRQGRQARRDAFARVADGARHARDVGAGRVAQWRDRGEPDEAPGPVVPAMPTTPIVPLGGYVRDESPGGPDELVPHVRCGGKGCDACGGDGEVPAWTQDPKHGVIPPLESVEQGAWRKPGGLPVDPRVVITDETVHADDFTYAGDSELRRLAAGGNRAAARELIRRANERQSRESEEMDEPKSELHGWTAEERREARSVADTGKCCWVTRDRGFDGPRELCGAPIRKGYIFCVEHLGDLHEQADRPDRFRFDQLDIDAPERLDADDFFHPDEYERWLRENFDEDGNPINQSPAQGGANKGEHVSNSNFPAEKVGAAQYVPAWDTPGPTLELTMATISTLVEELAASAEANSHHEVGGVQDVVGKGQAVVEAIQAFGEAIGAHAAELHAEHDRAIEATTGSSVESQREYAGAQ